MADRPEVVAFDVVGTLFSLEKLRDRLTAVGLPAYALDIWFAQLLRDAFALDATNVYRPFGEVATATLANLLAESAATIAFDANAEKIMDGFRELDAHPDAAQAMRTLRNAGIRIVTLTNGGASTTETLLKRAGLCNFVERVISIDEVRRWKPHRDVYLHCAATVGIAPHRLALIAVHGWDIHGANQAGLATGYVSRGKPFPSTMHPPDVIGVSLVDVAEQFTA